MGGIIIFGGTSEGRRLAEACAERKIPAVMSVVSGYGEELLPESPFLQVHRKALTKEEMKEWLQKEQPELVVDATHPYAVCVTQYIKECCEESGLSRIRVVREKEAFDHKKEGDGVVFKETAEEAAEYLSRKEGNILLTTGSKELEAFTAIDGYETRLFVRVLPSQKALEKCAALSLKGRQIIAMQGPFSTELNRAMIRQLDIRFLVTKEAGTAGGFEEKMEAAAQTGTEAVVIARPSREAGMSLEEAKDYLLSRFSEKKQKKRILYLIGIGMGGPGQITEEGAIALRKSQVIFGAQRMIRGAGKKAGDALPVPEYQPEAILSWMEAHPEIRTGAAVYSGDPGFYSGAAGLIRLFKSRDPEEKRCSLQVIPGVSTVSYMAARLKKDWQSTALFSSHGRECPLEEALGELETHPSLFLLTGGRDGGKELLRRLGKAEEARKEAYRVWIGENLSYPEERILEGRPKELEQEQIESLCAMWIEKDQASLGGK